MNAEDVLQHVDRLPSIPAVVAQLLATLQREDADTRDIARMLGADQALCAKLLRLANSAFYRKSRTVSSVQDAAVLLGTHALRTLVAGIGVAGSLPFPPGFDRRLFWRHSLLTAVAARHLARKARIDPEAAFTAGLLHSVGAPLIGLVLPEQAQALDHSAAFFERGRAAAERRLLGFDHAEVGMYLAQRWSFPAGLASAIRHAAAPLDAEPFDALAGVVWLASGVAACHELDLPRSEVLAGREAALLPMLGLARGDIVDLPPLPELAAGLESLVG